LKFLDGGKLNFCLLWQTDSRFENWFFGVTLLHSKGMAFVAVL